MKIPIRPDNDPQPNEIEPVWDDKPESYGQTGTIDEQGNFAPLPPDKIPPTPKKVIREFIQWLKNWRLNDLQQWMMGMARGALRRADQKAQIAWANKYVQSIIDLFPKRPKTVAERVRAYRQRKLAEAEKQQIEEKINELHALYPAYSTKILRRYLASETHVQTPQEFYEQMLERIKVLEAPTRLVTYKSPDKLEEIRAAIERDAAMGGRRGRPDSFGSDSSDRKGQELYGTSLASRAQWKKFTERQQDAYQAVTEYSFLDENFENKTETEDGIKIRLHCKLCSWQSAPDGINTEDELDDEDIELNTQWQWDDAHVHARREHKRELNRFLRNHLPAFMSVTREQQLMGKKACSVDHERIRKEAVERREPMPIECKCGELIYDPDSDLKNNVSGSEGGT